ncbi:MAG: DUF5668 domain-containing protein [Sphingobacteriaceae bacterium]|nr:DUF5668 domain-containing protein [Sphingobacteriaceae bacterium]
MKLDRVIWGVVLLFIGGVLLLDNFNVIEFYWSNVWKFWPVFLIIIGVNILFNRNNSQTGNIISLAIVVITLSFLFVKGQEKPEGRWWSNNIKIDMDDENSDGTKASQSTFVEPFTSGDELKKSILEISGGGTSFELKGSSDSLFLATVHKKNNNNFGLTKIASDSVNTLIFKSQDKNRRSKWSIGDGNNNVDLYLNTKPIWEMNLKLGAGEMDFDLKEYKVRTLNFDGGAADINFKLGDLLPITDVNVKTGVADVKISIPESSGCRIKTKTGLSSKDFNGFKMISEGVYETANYQSSTKKIFINFDGGLSSFEVNRY